MSNNGPTVACQGFSVASHSPHDDELAEGYTENPVLRSVVQISAMLAQQKNTVSYV